MAEPGFHILTNTVWDLTSAADRALTLNDFAKRIAAGLLIVTLTLTGCGGGSISGGGGGCGNPRVDVTGMWTASTFSFPGDGNNRDFEIFLKQDDGKLTGMVSSPPCLVETPIVGGEVKDAAGTLEICGIEYDITFKAEWQETKISFFGTVFISGDLINADYVLESSNPNCPQVEAANVFMSRR